tara:strand:+ start:1394 stop:1600 length:207 start_codon:yes stop_codon:yes gene_type:complete
MKLIYEKNSSEVKTGDVAHTFRGEPVVVTGWQHPRHEGSTGKVYCASMDGRGWQMEWYPSVIGAKWVD